MSEPVAELDFERELAALLNKYSMDNATNTPDFILARHIIRDLDTYRETKQENDSWHNSNMKAANNDDLRTT